MDFVKEVEVFCAEHRLKPSALMARAGVPIRTWHSWRGGADPKLSNV